MIDASVRSVVPSVVCATLCLVAALASGCGSSAPIRYHTLLAASETGQLASPRLDFFIDVQPVEVPPYADRTQLVFRTSTDEVVLAERERWIAPLSDELRTSLSLRLASELGTADVSGQPHIRDRQVLHIRVQMRRFDSAPDRYVAEEAVWGLRSDEGAISVDGCVVRTREDVGPTGEDIVHGHQRLLAELASRIAVSVRQAAAGQPPVCGS